MPFSYVQFQGSVTPGPSFSVGFPFLLRAHVRLYRGLDLLTGIYSSLLVDGTDYNWTSATQVQLAAPLASGVTLTIRRETPTASRMVDWADGSNLTAADMDTADLQNLYVVQELQDKADLAASVAAATSTAVAAALPYAVVANVASIPVSEAGTRIEIADSTGIESYSPLTGRPAGFVGGPQIRVRLVRSLPTWNWVDYAIADPDGRYVRQSSISSSTTSTSTTTVASSAAVKVAKDAADAAAASVTDAVDTAYAAMEEATTSLVNTTRLVDGSVTTSKIAAQAVTTAKVADAAITPGKLAQPMTHMGTVQASGVHMAAFSGIPSWARRITLLFAELSLSGTSHILIRFVVGNQQISSGYSSTSFYLQGGGQYVATSTSGIVVYSAYPPRLVTGTVTLILTNTGKWIASGVHVDNVGGQLSSGGSAQLSGAPTEIAVVPTGDSDTFDAGSISLIYEG